MIRSPSPKKKNRAFTGVRLVECTLPMNDGNSPSRPALKMSRAWELVPAIKAPNVEVMPAKNAKNNSTADISFATVRNGTAAPLSLLTLPAKPTTVALGGTRWHKAKEQTEKAVR